MRPWKIWLVFALCAAVLLAVMGWVSATALHLDHAQAQARQQAESEGNVRLALWRMDSMLAPLIAQETARPYFAYNAFYAAERAYGKMFNALDPGEVLVPSPLLTQVSSNVLLHFQFDPHGQLTSPQVPMGNQRDLAEAQFTTHERIQAATARLRQFELLMAQAASPELARLAIPASNPPPAATAYRPPALSGSTGSSDASRSPSSAVTAKATSSLDNRRVLLSVAPPLQAGGNLLALNASPVINWPVQERLKLPLKKESQQLDSAQRQIARNDEELQARNQSVQQAFDLNLKNTLASYRPATRVNVAEGLIRPLWFGDSLVLIRRVAVQGQEYVQGCWLDWPGIRRWLLGGVKDLLPDAKLEPLRSNGDDPEARMLASLPVRVLPGPAPLAAESLASPIFFALILAWVCVLVAGVAVALLLQGTLSLSERRAAFVSAVTHELRTPLTTFKMYSEMLAGGLVTDAQQRGQYLDTLCAEADRLNHLVENVLAYARLERGSARRRIERVTLRELIERVKPRLVQRAEQAGTTLQEDLDEAALNTAVQVDVAAVEQILFNLVDNACKHAAPAATNKIIHLEALPETGRFAMLRVRDHGQGISAAAARRLFQPFNRSAHEAARTVPGVGLGLALCRRLSRELGGDLRLDAGVKAGACFELRLPKDVREPASAASPAAA